MNIFEAKQYLRKKGYRIIKEGTGIQYYVSFEISGDRAHNEPDYCYIKKVTKNKEDLIDEVVDFYNYGPDDITFHCVMPVAKSMAEMLKKNIDEDMADTPICGTLLNKFNELVYRNAAAEFGFNDYYDLFDDMEEPADMEQAEFDSRVREYVVQELNRIMR